jgi:hypothetical protein
MLTDQSDSDSRFTAYVVVVSILIIYIKCSATCYIGSNKTGGSPVLMNSYHEGYGRLSRDEMKQTRIIFAHILGKIEMMSPFITLFLHRAKFCYSADVNCGLNCTSPRPPSFDKACIFMFSTSACSAEDIAAKRWVRMYWSDTGSETLCNEGIWPMKQPGILEQVFCCASQGKLGCNAPGAAAPPIKCFKTSSTFPSGTCANKTTTYSVCAVNQTRANQKAAALTAELSSEKLAWDCSSALSKSSSFCRQYDRSVSARPRRSSDGVESGGCCLGNFHSSG